MTYTGFRSTISRHWIKILISLLVTAVVVITPIITTIQAVDSQGDYTVYNVGFENYTNGECSYITNQEFKSGGTAGVLNPVLGAKRPTDEAAIVLKDEFGNYINRVNGYKYFISFYTKTSDDFTSNVRIDAGMQQNTTAATGAQYWLHSAKTQWASADSLKKDWQFGYFNIATAVSNETARPYMSLYFSDNNSTYISGSVYVDDVSVIKYANDSSVLVFDENYAGGSSAVKVGKIGSTVTDLPTPERDGYEFGGWYTNVACSSDSEYTNRTSDGYAFPSVTTHLYAKWIKYEYDLDFESGFNITASKASDFEVVTNAEKAHGGEKYLKAVRTTTYHNLLRITDNDGSNISVCTGDTCIIRFYAMVENVEGVDTVDYVQFLPFMTAADNINSRKYPATTNKRDFYGNTERNVWHEITLQFTATATDTNNNAITMLALGLYRGSRAETVGNIYIDDISVTIIPSQHSYIRLDYDNLGSKFEILQGVAGTEVTLPTPEREGSEFVGWTDKATGELYAGNTIPETPAHLVAKYDKAQYHIGFEDGSITAWTGLSINKDTEHVLSGNNSLKAELSNAGGAYGILTDNGDTIVLEHGQKYVINFYYKVIDPNNTAKYMQIIFARVGAGIKGERITFDNDKLVIDTTSRRGEWLKYSYTVTVDTTKTPESNLLSIMYYVGTSSNDNTAQIYVDDITVHKVRETQSAVTFIYNDEKNQKHTVVGKKDSELSKPQVKKIGYLFKNWYSDNALTTVFDSWKFGAEDLTLYAGWKLEDTSRSWYLNFEDNNFISGWDGFALNTDPKYAMNSTNSVKLHKENSASVACYMGDNGQKITLEEGCTYVIKFNYMIVDVPEFEPVRWAQILFYTGSSSLGNRKLQTEQNKLVIDVNTKRNVWLEHTYAFTMTTDQPNSAYLLLMGYLGKSPNCCDVYVDNIYIQEYDSDTRALVFDYNDDTGRGEVVTGKIGTEIPYPSVTRSGYKLSNWYSDTKMSEKFESAVFTDKNLFLYAGWSIDQQGNKWHIDFEDYGNFIDDKRASNAYSVNDTLSHSGKQSLKCDYPGTVNSLATLNIKDKPFVVEPGATYVISYWSYVPSERQFETLSLIYFWTSNLNNNKSNLIRQSVAASKGNQMGCTQALLWNSPVDEWVKHTTVFTVSEDVGNNTALNIGLKGAPGATIVYIDDMTIQKIDKGNSYIIYYTNDDNETDYVVQGKAGQSVKPYVPENRNDCVFNGWFEDEACTVPVDDKTLMVLPEKGLSVFAWQLRARYGQDFENYTPSIAAVERDYELYTNAIENFDGKNVYEGNASMHRIGKSGQPKMFSVFTDKSNALEFEKEYVLTFWMKVDSFESQSDCLVLAHTNSWAYVRSVDSSASYEKILKLADCKLGEWKRYSYTFTNINAFIAFETPANSDIYFDDIRVYLKGYENRDGNLADMDITELSVVKNTVVVNNNKNNVTDTEVDKIDIETNKHKGIIVIIIIAVAAILLVAGGVVAIVLVRRKKSVIGGQK